MRPLNERLRAHAATGEPMALTATDVRLLVRLLNGLEAVHIEPAADRADEALLTVMAEVRRGMRS